MNAVFQKIILVYFQNFKMPRSSILNKFSLSDNFAWLKFLDTMSLTSLALWQLHICSVSYNTSSNNTSRFSSATVVDKFETSCVMLVNCACSNWMASVCRWSYDKGRNIISACVKVSSVH